MRIKRIKRIILGLDRFEHPLSDLRRRMPVVCEPGALHQRRPEMAFLCRLDDAGDRVIEIAAHSASFEKHRDGAWPAADVVELAALAQLLDQLNGIETDAAIGERKERLIHLAVRSHKKMFRPETPASYVE